jgi:hypothetical protein
MVFVVAMMHVKCYFLNSENDKSTKKKELRILVENVGGNKRCNKKFTKNSYHQISVCFVRWRRVI